MQKINLKIFIYDPTFLDNLSYKDSVSQITRLDPVGIGGVKNATTAISSG